MGHGATDLWPVRVLFVCWHNDLRSPLAEAILHHRAPGQFLARSAGIAPTRLHPLALSALADVGVDSTGLYAKGTHLFRDGSFDVVVTLCERTSAVPGVAAAATRLHWALADPLSAGGPVEQRAACGRLCAEIGERARLLIGAERGKRRRALTVRGAMDALPAEHASSRLVGR
jgi:arsenate reductase